MKSTERISVWRGFCLLGLALTAGVLTSTIVNVQIRLAGPPGQMHPPITYLFAAFFGGICLLVASLVHGVYAEYFSYSSEWQWVLAGSFYAGIWAALIFAQFWLALALAFAPLILRALNLMPLRRR